MADIKRSIVLSPLQPPPCTTVHPQDEAIFAASALAGKRWFTAAVKTLVSEISKAPTLEEQMHFAMCFQAIVSGRVGVVLELGDSAHPGDQAIFAASALGEKPWFAKAVKTLTADMLKATTFEERELAAMCFESIVFSRAGVAVIIAA